MRRLGKTRRRKEGKRQVKMRHLFILKSVTNNREEGYSFMEEMNGLLRTLSLKYEAVQAQDDPGSARRPVGLKRCLEVSIY